MSRPDVLLHRGTQLLCIFVGVLALTAGASATGCQSGQRAGEILPGRTRALLQHDWPHPRDFQFEPSRFVPPDPRTALVTTDSGLRAYILSDPSDALVRITAALPAGQAYERPNERGASEFIADALRRRRPGEPVAELMPKRLEVDLRLDALVLTLEVLSEDWREGLALVVARLRQFEGDEAFRRPYRTRPPVTGGRVDVAARGFQPRMELERVLGQHPLAPTPAGLEISTQVARALASRSIGPKQIVFGIGGHVNADGAAAALRDLTSGWDPSSDVPRRRSSPAAPPLASFSAIDTPILEGWAAIGRRIGDVPLAEHGPLAVLAHILNTRLNIAAREIRGLTNRAIFVLPESVDGGGLMYVATGGRSEAVAPLVKFCRDELARLHRTNELIGAEEMERAKSFLVVGEWQAALDGQRQASATYAIETVRRSNLEEFLSWPATIEAVTAEQVKTVAAKYLDPADMVTVVVGPIEQIRQARHPRWPISFDELKLSGAATH